jgi:hypothetical protein
MIRYTHRQWWRVSEPCQYPAKPGGLCIAWQTHYMKAPAFWYYDSWIDVPPQHRDLQAFPQHTEVTA